MLCTVSCTVWKIFLMVWQSFLRTLQCFRRALSDFLIVMTGSWMHCKLSSSLVWQPAGCKAWSLNCCCNTSNRNHYFTAIFLFSRGNFRLLFFQWPASSRATTQPFEEHEWRPNGTQTDRPAPAQRPGWIKRICKKSFVESVLIKAYRGVLASKCCLIKWKNQPMTLTWYKEKKNCDFFVSYSCFVMPSFFNGHGMFKRLEHETI